MSVKQLIKYLH